MGGIPLYIHSSGRLVGRHTPVYTPFWEAGREAYPGIYTLREASRETYPGTYTLREASREVYTTVLTIGQVPRGALYPFHCWPVIGLPGP